MINEKWIELAKLASGCCGCGCCCRATVHELAAELLRSLGYTHHELKHPELEYTPSAWRKPKENKS